MSNPLTRDEINDLQHGEHLIIIWSGGNGPHYYRSFRLDEGEIFAATDKEFLENELPSTDRRINGKLSFTGENRPYTQVWRLDNVY